MLVLADPGCFPTSLLCFRRGLESGTGKYRMGRSAGSDFQRCSGGAMQGANPQVWCTQSCLPVLGALLYCFSFSFLPFLLPGFSASAKRRKMPSYTWFNLSKDASAAKGRLCICPLAQVRDSTIPLPGAPTNTLQPPALSDLTKTKPAEKEGEKGGWFGAGLLSCSIKERWLELTQGRGCRQRAPGS